MHAMQPMAKDAHCRPLNYNQVDCPRGPHVSVTAGKEPCKDAGYTCIYISVLSKHKGQAEDVSQEEDAAGMLAG